MIGAALLRVGWGCRRPDMRDDTYSLRSGSLTATIKAHGAELCSLKDDSGIEFVWQAGPEWPRHAPLLFPIVGRLANDELRHRGKTYRMTQHGFARDSRFAWAERGESRCTLVLDDSAATHALYPFAFRLTAAYAIDDTGLDLTFTIANTGKETLPASLGGHPAFNWPLQPGLAKESYALTFARAESSPVRRLDGGLLRPAAEPSPVKGSSLPLSDSCSPTTPSSSTGSRARRSAMPRGRVHRLGRGWKCPGAASASSASGRNRQARRSSASSRGAAMPVPPASTASSPTSRA